MGSPGDRSGLSLASQGFGVCGRVFASMAPSCPPSLPPLPPARPGIVLGHKHTHVIGTPDQRGRPTGRLSMVPLCTGKSARRWAPGREEGPGGGRPYKDTCHPERPADDDVKAAPGGGGPPLAAGSCPSDSQETRALCVASAEGTTVLGSPQRPPLPWVCVIRQEPCGALGWQGPARGHGSGGNRHGMGPGKAANVVGDSVTSGQVARLLGRACRQLAFLKSLLCARHRVVRGGYKHAQLGVRAGRVLCCAQPLWGQRHPGACSWTGCPKRLTHIVSSISRAALNKEVL